MIVFKNEGLIDLRGVTTFGVCAKETKNPIGYFGTGLKYAIAVLLREGCEVTLWLGTKSYVFRTQKTEVRGQEFDFVYMNNQEMPFTTALGRNWELWMAYRELYSNAADETGGCAYAESESRNVGEEGYTKITVTGDKFEEVHKEQNEIFLQTKPRYTFKGVELHDCEGSGKWLFYRGIRVHKLTKPALYNYNLTGSVSLTEDRTLDSIYTAYFPIAKAIASCDDPGLIRQILEANDQYFESTIDYHWSIIVPGTCFNKVMERYIHTRSRGYNTSAKKLYQTHHPEKPRPQALQMESIPIGERRKLWAALVFWSKLGINIPRDSVHVTDTLGESKGVIFEQDIYISKHVLKGDMRHLAGQIYKLYTHTRPKLNKVTSEQLLIDTIVDFGERLLDLQPHNKVA
jgi:hypothetical protein